MARPIFEDLPSTDTPINANNLNILGDGVANIGTSVDSSYRVNLLETKNLFDKNNNDNIKNAYLKSTGEIGTSNDFFVSYYIEIPQNANKITISGSAGQNENICFYNSSKTFITYANMGTDTTKTIDIPSGSLYLRTTIKYTSKESYQIEVGDTATTYSSFIPNSIYVNGNKFTDTLNVGTSVDSRSRVNVLYSKNLTSIKKGNNVIIATLSAGTYTFSFDYTNDVGFNLKVDNSSGSTIGSKNLYGSGRGSYTFTLTTTTNVFLNGFGITSGVSWADNTDNFQLEEGSTPTTYEPYITPSIYVDNEMLVSKNVYSSSEVVIGEWFGKPLYRKVIEITNPTLDAWATVNHNIANMDFGRIVDATITRTIYGATSFIPIGVSNISAGTLFTCDLQKTIFEYKIAGYTNITKLTAVLEYTKTTD